MDKNVILKIAKLSKLQLSDEDLEKFEKEFNSILKYMEQLQEVDVEGIEPYMTPITGQLRKDEVRVEDMLDKETILGLAANHDDNYFIVPTVSTKN